MTPLSADTDPVAEEVWIRLLRNASEARRFRLVSSLSASVIRWSQAAMRDARPDAREQDLRVEFVRLNYGEALADAVRTRLAAGGRRTGQ